MGGESILESINGYEYADSVTYEDGGKKITVIRKFAEEGDLNKIVFEIAAARAWEEADL